MEGNQIVYIVLAAVLVLFVLVVLFKSIRIVPQKQAIIIERLGKFNTAGEAGLNVLIPFIDAVRATVDLREQITQIEPQPVITKDNVTMSVDAVIYYSVMNPVRATYEIQNLRWGLEQLTLSALRNVLGSMDLDHTLTSRDTINTQLRSLLDMATEQWGVKIMRVELKNITPPEDVRVTMEKQMAAERSRRAVVTTAEGEKSSAILRAEGQRQSQVINAEAARQTMILTAEGEANARLQVAQAEAQAIQMVAQALGQFGNPSQYLIAQKYLDSLNKIANNAQKIVFLPYEATGVMGTLGSLKELFGVDSSGATPAASTNRPVSSRPPTP